MPVDLLKESALFSTVSDAQREETARVCQTQTYKPGETIFKAGEPRHEEMRSLLVASAF